MKNKGQIGTTLTWVVAFSLILFILALFIIITITASFAKNIKIIDWVSDYGKNEISVSGEKIYSFDKATSREIYSLLKGKMDYSEGEVRIEEILKYYIASKNEKLFDSIIAKVKNEMDMDHEECYALCFMFVDGDSKEKKQIIGEKCPEIDSACIYDDSYMKEGFMKGQYEMFFDNKICKIKLFVKDKNVVK